MTRGYDAERLSNCLAVMAEPVRIRIMSVIASKGEVCARDILPEFSVTQPTLSHHMRVLVDNDLVTARKEGRNVYYSVNQATVRELADLLVQLGEPPVVQTTPEGKGLTNKRSQTRRRQAKAPALKKSSSVPVQKVPAAAPDIEKLKKKKKKKSKDKDKDKKKDKKKKK
jgi:DNA-binding transcriptional ArsR family regulator